MRDIKRIETTGDEPVSLLEAKKHLRIITEDEDNYISGLISLAREYCENFTRRSFISASFLLTLSAFPYPGKPIVIPYPQLKQVDWVKYKDKEGILKTIVENEDYLVICSSSPGVIVPIPGRVWPADIYNVPDAVQIQYQTEPVNIPVSIKQAILLLAGHYYENREMSTDRKMNELPLSVHSLLWPYRLLEF